MTFCRGTPLSRWSQSPITTAISLSHCGRLSSQVTADDLRHLADHKLLDEGDRRVEWHCCCDKCLVRACVSLAAVCHRTFVSAKASDLYRRCASSFRQLMSEAPSRQQ